MNEESKRMSAPASPTPQWKLVPAITTREMESAYWKARPGPRDVWQAMYDAAPASEGAAQAEKVDPVHAEILEIMRVYDEQVERNKGYPDTPGGLEHMGDVWRLLDSWREQIIAAKGGVS